jgi:hypothetical protein
MFCKQASLKFRDIKSSEFNTYKPSLDAEDKILNRFWKPNHNWGAVLGQIILFLWRCSDLIVKADGLKEDVLTVKEQEYLSEKRPD